VAFMSAVSFSNPNAGLGIRTSAVGPSSPVPQIAYDLRLWNAYSVSSASGGSGESNYRPNRVSYYP
jgi:hypothetical protein